MIRPKNRLARKPAESTQPNDILAAPSKPVHTEPPKLNMMQAKERLSATLARMLEDPRIEPEHRILLNSLRGIGGAMKEDPRSSDLELREAAAGIVAEIVTDHLANGGPILQIYRVTFTSNEGLTPITKPVLRVEQQIRRALGVLSKLNLDGIVFSRFEAVKQVPPEAEWSIIPQFAAIVSMSMPFDIDAVRSLLGCNKHWQTTVCAAGIAIELLPPNSTPEQIFDFVAEIFAPTYRATQLGRNAKTKEPPRRFTEIPENVALRLLEAESLKPFKNAIGSTNTGKTSIKAKLLQELKKWHLQRCNTSRETVIPGPYSLEKPWNSIREALGQTDISPVVFETTRKPKERTYEMTLRDRDRKCAETQKKKNEFLKKRGLKKPVSASPAGFRSI